MKYRTGFQCIAFKRIAFKRIAFPHIAIIGLLLTACLSHIAVASEAPQPQTADAVLQPTADFMPPQELQQQIQQYLTQQLSKEYPGLAPQDIQIVVSNLDPRLRLQPCGWVLHKAISTPRPYGNNLSVKVNCAGPHPWTIYVPARIHTYAEVAVLARTLERGTTISAEDVQMVRMNTAQAGFGHILAADQVVGMSLKRRLSAGDPVRLSHIEPPQVVRRGDRVVIEAGTGGVSVMTMGRAMIDGQIGDHIRIRNEHSNRVVDAQIIAPGRARVDY